MTSTFNHTITGHCSYMSDNETKEDTSTPTMTKEEGFRAFVDKLDFWGDMPMFIRVLSEKLSRGNRTRGKNGVSCQTRGSHVCATSSPKEGGYIDEGDDPFEEAVFNDY